VDGCANELFYSQIATGFRNDNFFVLTRVCMIKYLVECIYVLLGRILLQARGDKALELRSFSLLYITMNMLHDSVIFSPLPNHAYAMN
jgi:hypothetical protein